MLKDPAAGFLEGSVIVKPLPVLPPSQSLQYCTLVACYRPGFPTPTELLDSEGSQCPSSGNNLWQETP